MVDVRMDKKFEYHSIFMELIIYKLLVVFFSFEVRNNELKMVDLKLRR